MLGVKLLGFRVCYMRPFRNTRPLQLQPDFAILYFWGKNIWHYAVELHGFSVSRDSCTYLLESNCIICTCWGQNYLELESADNFCSTWPSQLQRRFEDEQLLGTGFGQLYKGKYVLGTNDLELDSDNFLNAKRVLGMNITWN